MTGVWSRALARRAMAAAAMAATVAVGGPVAAQYTHDPFFTDTVLLSRAIGLEMTERRLVLALTIPPPDNFQLIEQMLAMTRIDCARFGSTLAARDPELARTLFAALQEVEMSIRMGADAARAAAAALPLVARAYELLVDPAMRESPQFKAAVMAELLLADGGVSEGYEEAVWEPWSYASGWSALQRIDALWRDVAPLATPARRAYGEREIDALHALYPQPQPPQPFVGRNPEEAENPSQFLVGLLEEITDTNLYTARDLPRLAAHLRTVLAPACESYDDAGIAAEVVRAVHVQWDTHRGNLMALIAPEVQTAVDAAFRGLIVVEVDDDEFGPPARKGPFVGEGGFAATLPDPAAACRELLASLEQMRRAVGG
ncbi:MAG: hypothetical protein O2905_03070 [Proteobacteria bacterium]|nr:hypothetical protein [Pseudomonadota bacterium]